MNKLQEIFSTNVSIGQAKKLGIYFTAGFPNINSLPEILSALNKTSVDFIEIGIPFSDSLVDEPVIQAANIKALNNGMNLKLLFEQLESFFKENPVTKPILLMGGLNPVIQYGFENFCKSCVKSNVSGFILPEISPECYLRDYKKITDQYNLSNIFLIAPDSTEARIKFIDSISNSFIYVVSSTGITGSTFNSNSNSNLNLNSQGKSVDNSEKIKAYLNNLLTLNLKSPTMLGFGIKDKTTFDAACQFGDGGIIGSEFLRVIECIDNSAINKQYNGELENKISEYIDSLK